MSVAVIKCTVLLAKCLCLICFREALLKRPKNITEFAAGKQYDVGCSVASTLNCLLSNKVDSSAKSLSSIITNYALLQDTFEESRHYTATQFSLHTLCS